MKLKKLFLLIGIFAVTCVGTYAATGDDKGLSDEDLRSVLGPELPKWNFLVRTYLEREDFDNGSPLIQGDNEDGLFWGVGFNAGLGKWNFDLTAERRWGGDWNSADYDTMRVDYKVRYQLIPEMAFHLKYRSENRDRDYDKSSWYNSATRDRIEVGTDFDLFKGYLSGWLVGGHDEDKYDTLDPLTGQVNGSGRDHGNYWEGDFGPTFKITDRISIKPTLYTTGEYYESYRMTEEQLRIMATFKITDRISLIPRIRITLDKDLRNKPNTDVGYDIDFGERIRYELLSDIKITDRVNAFVGIAYDDQDRRLVDSAGKTDGKSINMWWWTGQLSYSF
ncbi:MAG: hypothetical protein KBF12_13285 [Sebaldella sp.]|nr:hypothetical protein [Sebaldella sp.]